MQKILNNFKHKKTKRDVWLLILNESLCRLGILPSILTLQSLSWAKSPAYACCALCEPECPANAIFSEDEVPKGQEMFIQLNEELAQKWPNITEMKEQMPEAAKWDGVEGKIQYLEK